MVRAAEGSADLLWRYLDYLVCQQGSTQPDLHTELALTLTDVTLKLLPKPDGAAMGQPSACQPCYMLTTQQWQADSLAAQHDQLMLLHPV